MTRSCHVLTCLILFAGAGPLLALQPQHVFLIVNQNVPDSRAIAEHYCQKRRVPLDHIINLDLPAGEDISRADYNSKLVAPLRERLQNKREQVGVLLTIYGVPLRVGGQEPNPAEKQELAKLNEELGQLQRKEKELRESLQKLEEVVKKNKEANEAKQLPDTRKELEGVTARIRPLEQRRRWLSHSESHAAVDSELAMLWHDGYELRRWQINPHYFQVPAERRAVGAPVVMTCRLDGPTPALVKRLIDESIAVEARGLAGKVYVDARGIRFDPKSDTGHGYGGYDESLREMARLLEKEAKLPVVLDDKPELFASGKCTDCALYCGWYSLANYVDCCRFAPGAVAYHIASSEAVTLRDANTKQWCKNLLQAGAVATLGPVAEPYTVGFPKPAEFFGFLVTGEYPLVECYWKTALAQAG